MRPASIGLVRISGSQALHQEADVLDRRVQEIKGSRRRHLPYLDAGAGGGQRVVCWSYGRRRIAGWRSAVHGVNKWQLWW